MRIRFLSYLLNGLIVLAINALTGYSADWQPAKGPLATRWAKDVSPTNALPEYPRPQMVRKEWLNLNGLWRCVVTDRAAISMTSMPLATSAPILVPYPFESSLSGVGKRIPEDHKLWYRRTFKVAEK